MSIYGENTLRHQNGTTILLYPSVDRLYTPLGYDLRIGCAVILEANKKNKNKGYSVYDNSRDDKLILPSYSSLLVGTLEFVWLSSGLVGKIYARGSYASRGLVISASTVDPNWQDQMIMRLFNSNPYQIEIDCLEPFATLMIEELDSTTRSRSVSNPRRIIEEMGEMYGGWIKGEFSDYFNCKNNQAVKSSFDTHVETAQRNLRRWWPSRKMINVFNALKSDRDYRKRAAKSTFIHLLFVMCFSLGIPVYLLTAYREAVNYPEMVVFIGLFCGFVTVFNWIFKLFSDYRKAITIKMLTTETELSSQNGVDADDRRRLPLDQR